MGFSLVRGGPLHTLLRALRLHVEKRAALAFLLVTWCPLMVLALIELIDGRTSLIATDFSVHARLLLAIPLLFLGERSLHVRTQRCIERFVEGHWAPGQEDAVTRATRAAERLRDAIAPEVILIVLAVVFSQIVFRGLVPFRMIRERAIGTEWVPIKIWYAYVSLPLYQFLIGRWLWRWIIWCYLLWRLSRLQIKPVATHPDRHGGLGFLAEPTVGFAWIVLASSMVQAGVWANKVVFADAHVMGFKKELIVMLVVNLLFSIAPLMFFCQDLWRCRFEAIRQYDDLAMDYGRQFQRRWMQRHDRADLLGAPDIQSLADLGNSYGVVEKMRFIPLNIMALVVIAAATVAPTIPVILLEIPVMELLQKVGSVAMGGLPG